MRDTPDTSDCDMPRLRVAPRMCGGPPSRQNLETVGGSRGNHVVDANAIAKSFCFAWEYTRPFRIWHGGSASAPMLGIGRPRLGFELRAGNRRLLNLSWERSPTEAKTERTSAGRDGLPPVGPG